jgi:hypothetical protein
VCCVWGCREMGVAQRMKWSSVRRSVESSSVRSAAKRWPTDEKAPPDRLCCTAGCSSGAEKRCLM